MSTTKVPRSQVLIRISEVRAAQLRQLSRENCISVGAVVEELLAQAELPCQGGPTVIEADPTIGSSSFEAELKLLLNFSRLSVEHLLLRIACGPAAPSVQPTELQAEAKRTVSTLANLARDLARREMVLRSQK